MKMNFRNFKHFILTLFITGCASVNEGLQSLNNTLASVNESMKIKPVQIKEPISEVCSETNSNVERANNKYAGKGLTFTATIKDNFSRKFTNSFLAKGNNVPVVHLS